MPAGPGEIALGYCHNGWVRAEFMASLFQLHSGPAARLIGQTIATSGGTLVSFARNRLVEKTLQSDSQWLFMIDTDMAFTPAQFVQLVMAGDETDRPVMTAPAAVLDKDGTGTAPNLYAPVENDDGEVTGFLPLEELPAKGLIQVDACGAAFMLIHRSVLEKLSPGEWFREGYTPSGGIRGEDISFCTRVTAAGFPIWADCGVRPGHMKTVCITID